jgi:hypothetical protein
MSILDWIFAIIVAAAERTISCSPTNLGSPPQISFLDLTMRRRFDTWSKWLHMDKQARKGKWTRRRGGFRRRGSVFQRKRCVCINSLTIITWRPVYQEIDVSTRNAISRVTNIIQVLSSHFVPLTDTLLLEAYEWTVEQEGGAVNLLQEDCGDALVSFLTSV